MGPTLALGDRRKVVLMLSGRASMAGVTIRVKIVANDSPKTIVDASPAH